MTQMRRMKCTTNKNSFEDRYKVRRVEIDSIYFFTKFSKSRGSYEIHVKQNEIEKKLCCCVLRKAKQK